jgi:glycosyltransferase involved in cell wall biosynthesis
MRIAFVHPRFPSAEGTGAAHSATQIVSGLSDAGHDIQVYCPQLPEKGPETTNLELRHLAGNSRHPHTNTRLNKEIVSRRNELQTFDVVHSYMTPLLPSIARVGEDSDVKTVVTLNAYGGTCAKNDLLYLNREKCQNKSTHKCLNCIARTGFENDDHSYLYQFASKLFSLRLINAGESRLENVDAFRAPSAHVRENYVQFGYDQDRISVIPHPLDDRFDVPHTSEFIEPYKLLYVGYLEKHKGVEKLIPLMASLAESNVDFSLTIAGSGGLESTLQAQAKEYGVTDAIEFLGFVPYEELPEVYASHDCFVYPGIWDEPLARVYLECFATGTPVVTSEYGSIEEIVGNAGRVTDGSPAGFRDALLDIVADGELDTMSSAAKDRVAEFRLSKIIGEIEKMYAEIDSSDREQLKTP